MPLVKNIDRSSNKWCTITYTDESKYCGYTKDSYPQVQRHGLGTYYDKDENIIFRGEWIDDEMHLPIPTEEFDKRLR